MQIGACYIRVSTEDQAEFSPAAQQRAIFAYAKKNNITIPESFIFIDEGISGRKAEKRPAFMQMIAFAKRTPRPFDIILVHKFDRFARNREDSVVYKSLLRKECDIRVISITEQLEDDKFSIILESMLEAMAEYYSLNLSDEVKKGMFEKARRGEHIGKAPYGYFLNQKVLSKNPQEAFIVKKIYSLFIAENKTIAEIASILNQNHLFARNGAHWRCASLEYLLANPVYCGFCRYNYMGKNHVQNPSADWILAKGSHEPLIPPLLFQRAQEKLQKTPFTPKSEKPYQLKSWCQHLAYCAVCGHVLTISTSGNGKYSSFRCGYKEASACPVTATCSVKKLERAISTLLDDELPMPFPFSLIQKQMVAQNKEEHIYLLKQQNRIKNELLRAKNAYLAQVDTLAEYKQTKATLLQELEKITTALAQYEQSSSARKPQKIISIHSFTGLLEEPFSIEEKQKIIRTVLYQIQVNLATKEISFVYSA